MKKIVYGICGKGKGHFLRQLPVIDFLISQNHKILFFVSGARLGLAEIYKDNPLVKIVHVSTPYFAGNSEGLDFKITDVINANFNYSFNSDRSCFRSLVILVYVW